MHDLGNVTRMNKDAHEEPPWLCEIDRYATREWFIFKPGMSQSAYIPNGTYEEAQAICKKFYSEVHILVPGDQVEEEEVAA